MGTLFIGSNAIAQVGPYNVNNNTECDISAIVYAYNEGDCNTINNCSTVGNTGWQSVPAGQSINIASGYSGSGDVWGYVRVSYLGSVAYDGHTDCYSQGGGLPAACATANVYYYCACADVTP